MGDHRATITIEFTMHGVTSKAEGMWMNWWEDAAPHNLPSMVTEFFADAEAKSMRAYYDAQDRAEDEANRKRKALAEQAKAKLTPDEIDAIKNSE